MIRKLQRNKKYYIVEVPIEWIRANKLEKATDIEIQIEKNGDLVCRPLRIRGGRYVH